MSIIRVLHVFGGLDAGGAESRTMDIYREIDKTKIQFDFLIHSSEKGFFEDEINSLGGRIYRVPRYGIKTILSYKKEVKKFYEKHPEYQIVHGHILTTAFIYQKLAKVNGIPMRIAHSRSGTRAQLTPINIFKELAEKLSRNYVTDMFAVSKLAGYSAFGKKNVERNKVIIQPNAINASRYSYDPIIRERLRKELKLEGKFVVGHVGRFTAQKNHSFLVEIFKSIKNHNRNSLPMLIGDGPLKKVIAQKVKKYNLANDVIFLGIRSDVTDLMQVMDTLVFPSTHEGLPGVVLEAQASGLPCFISDKITPEVKITDLVEYVSLDEKAKYWAERLNYYMNEFVRENTYKKIVDSGYDIKSVAKWYEAFYCSVEGGFYDEEL